MSGLTAEAIVDLVKTTLAELGRMEFNQIAQTITTLEVMKRLLKQERIVYQDGTSIQFNLMFNHNQSFRMVGLHEQYDRDIKDVMQNGNVRWAHGSYFWGWERRELLMNKGKSKIVDLIKTRRTSALISAAEGLEEQFWNKPDDSDDEKSMFGVPYWVVKNATVGFNGGDPSGFSGGAANLPVATYPRWKNRTGGYSAVTEEDLVDKMIHAYRLTGFVSPVDVDDYRRGNGQRFRIYMNEPTIRAYEKLARRQNSDLGADLARYQDEAAFKKIAVKYCAKLDADTQDPVYMLDFNFFHIAALKGDTMYEHDPRTASGQPNSWFVDVDLTANPVCTDRRRQTVLHKV